MSDTSDRSLLYASDDAETWVESEGRVSKIAGEPMRDRLPPLTLPFWCA